jgi:hypothetical protein
MIQIHKMRAAGRDCVCSSIYSIWTVLFLVPERIITARF